MELKRYECIGFHGTKEENAKNILSTKKFLDSRDDEEWLGTGVYFFENDKKQAEYYVKAKKFKNPKILQAKISSDKTLDLCDTETYELFYKFAVKLKDKYKKRKDKKPRMIINSVVLNSLYNLKEYDVVRGTFNVPYMVQAPRTNLCPTHTQVCVRNHDCISDLKEAL